MVRDAVVDLESPDDIALADRMRDGREQIVRELKKLIVGQDDVVGQILLTLFVGGNSLIVGVPGLAKTLLIHTMARVLELKFSRIQFTPDLMPSDITGTDIIQEDPATGRRQMVFSPGPIFANIVLADEINRTPPKTQSALLEAMQEHRVTIQGRTYTLDEPFYVFATQNPVEPSKGAERARGREEVRGVRRERSRRAAPHSRREGEGADRRAIPRELRGRSRARASRTAAPRAHEFPRRVGRRLERHAHRRA